MWGIEISLIEIFSAVAIAQGIGMARLQSKFEWSAYFARFVFLCAQSHTIDREDIPKSAAAAQSGFTPFRQPFVFLPEPYPLPPEGVTTLKPLFRDRHDG